MTPNVFDQTSRYAAHQLDEQGFLAWLLPEVVARYGFERWLDARTLPFPGEPDRTCDTVAAWTHIDGTAPPLATVVEFLVEPSSDFLEKLADYTLQVRRDLLYRAASPRTKYEVVGVLVVLTGPEQRRTWETRPEGLGGAGGEFTAILRALASQSAEQTLGRVESGGAARCVLPWIPLMTGGGEVGIIERWKASASAEPDVRKRSDYGGLAFVFAELAGCRQTWERLLEGWDVVESQVIKGWMEKGRADTLRSNLDKVLRFRFQLIPTAIEEKVRVADLIHLQQWFDLALSATSLEDFQSRLNGA